MPAQDDAKTLELRTQQLATTLRVLANLENALREIGGTLSDSQTDALRAAHAHLELHGVIKPSQRLYAPTPPSWASDPPPWLRQEYHDCKDDPDCQLCNVAALALVR